MNCTQFRKYAGAFADGELNIQINLEVLEHLNMCPACTQRVDEITSLRSALQRTHTDHRAPADLLDRIRKAQEAGIDDANPVGSHAPAAVIGQLGRSRRLVLLSLAAVLVAVFFAWQYAANVNISSGTMTTLAIRTVTQVTRIHRSCSRARRADHHDPALPKDAVPLASELSRQLGFKVIVPDLTGSGYNLVGADFCSLGGRKTAHVLYTQQAKGGAAMSVFSTRSIPELRQPGADVFVREVGELTVVAWHDKGQTYTCCSELAERPMRKAINQFRTAMRRPGPAFLATVPMVANGPRPLSYRCCLTRDFVTEMCPISEH